MSNRPLVLTVDSTRYSVGDHVAETLTAVILESDDETGKETAAKKAAELIKTAMQEQKESEVRLFPDGVITKKSDTLEEYSEKVNKIKQYIRDGHIFQTVLSQRWTIATGQDGFDLYCELRELNPSPYLYYFNFGDFEVIGSSPEMLVKQQGNRVFTCPIAGTENVRTCSFRPFMIWCIRTWKNTEQNSRGYRREIPQQNG